MDKLIEKYKKSQSYIIVVFITVSATIFVMKGSSDSTFIENVNFASTLTSIVLSIIAILLTIIESSKNDSSIERMLKASISVDESTKTLNDSKVKIEEFIIKMTETQERFKNVEEGFNRVCDLYEDKELSISKESPEIENSDVLKEINLSKLIWKVPHAIRQYLLLISKTYKHGVLLDVNDFNSFFNKILIEHDLGTHEIYDGLINTLYILQGLNLIEFIFTSNRLLKIVRIDTELIKAIDTLISDEEYFEDSPALRYYGSVCTYFKELTNKEK